MVALDKETQDGIQRLHEWTYVLYAAMPVLSELLETILPGGSFRGDEYAFRNPTRDDRHIGSMSANVWTGRWLDRAVPDAKGRNIISLVAYVRGVSELEAAAQLRPIVDSERLREKASFLRLNRAKEHWTPIVPIPAEAGDFTSDIAGELLPGYAPTGAWQYRSADDQALCLVVRYEKPGASKITLPVSYARHADGHTAWRLMGIPGLRTLYNLEKLCARREAPVLVVEGEKTAEAAETLFWQYVAVTSAGGAQAAAKSDWATLRGRHVVVWPDNDSPGARYAEDVTRLAGEAGAASVRVVALPKGLPDGWDLADPAPTGLDLHALLRDASEDAAKTGQDPSWAEPDLALLRSDEQPAPPFPADMLGPFWAEWARSRARCAAAPVDYTATALLNAIGALLANVRWPIVPAQPGWGEPAFLWSVIVGGTGETKSPALRPILALLRVAEEKMAEGHDEKVREYEQRKLAANVVREKWEFEVREAVSNGEAAPELPSDAREPAVPVKPRILASDATTEKLAIMASQHPRGLLLARDEVAGWLATFNRSYGGGEADRAFALEMYNGDAHTQDRVKHTGNGIHVPHLSIGVIGGIQPERLSVITQGPKDGLSTRILYSWPSTFPDLAFAREAPEDGPAYAAVERLVRLSTDRDNEGRFEPRRIPLRPEAEDALEDFAKELQRRARLAHGHYAGALSKARGHVLRLSAILEFMWWCGAPGGPEPRVITIEATEAAIRLMDDYYLPMAKRTFGDAARSPAEQNAKILLRHLRERKQNIFNSRDAYRTIGEPLNNSKSMNEACELLVEHCLIRPKPSRIGDTKGRAKSNFEINPTLWVATS